MKTLNRNKNQKEGLTTKLLVSTLLVLSLAINTPTVFATSTTASVSELDSEINAKKNELNATNQRIKQLQGSVAEQQRTIKSLSDQMRVIDSRMELIQLQLKANQLDIEKTSKEIESTETQIKEKEEEMVKQKAVMDAVIRKLYMDRGVNLISIVVESQNFSQLVEKTEYLARIRTQLKEAIEKLKVLKVELEKQKNDLDEKMKGLEELKRDKQTEETGYENQKYAKAKLLEQTKGQEAAFKSTLGQAQAEENAITQEVIRLVQEQARRKRAAGGVEARAGRGDVVNTGGFSYPLAGTNRVSITGGDYMDPAYGLGFPHTGVDLAAAQGTALYAAGAGVVVVAHDSGNAGLSYIAIDHGNGLITKYLHLSAIFVAAGDVVNAGDLIGKTGGSPGTRGAGIFTTGAHLHFEITDYNGRTQNPHNYLNILPPLF